jgi:hypothetical protein
MSRSIDAKLEFEGSVVCANTFPGFTSTPTTKMIRRV